MKRRGLIGSKLYFAAIAFATLGLLANAEAQRPQPGSGYEKGTTLESYSSTGQSSAAGFRIWYVLSSEDAVVPQDLAPADGVPDLVAHIADTADSVHRLFVDSMGFRPPLRDSDYVVDTLAGGDSKFDFYLKHFGVGDGSYIRDGCLAPMSTCYGYVEIENDFDNSNYPSLEIAADVLVSHEYFHAIQAAYNSDADAKWSEGSAVWAEEKFNPEQDDFERLIASFLLRPWRPFDRAAGAAFDGWAYGAALWPWFLDERFGEELIEKIWDGLDTSNSKSTNFLLVTDSILRGQYNSSLAEAWIEFSQWNLFTGSRSDSERSYRNADHWPEVMLEEFILTDSDALFITTQQSEGMSSRYTPVVLPDIGGEKRVLGVSTSSGQLVNVNAYWVSDGRVVSEAIPLVPGTALAPYSEVELSWTGTPTLILVVVGSAIGAPQQSVEISMTMPMLPPDQSGGQGGCSIKHTKIVSSSTVFLLLIVLLGSRSRQN